jgi:hypothetical protein
MTPAECLAVLARYRTNERCRRCEFLDWALAQLQLVADYDLACEAAALRVPADRLEPSAECSCCPPLETVFAWLRETSSAPDA